MQQWPTGPQVLAEAAKPRSLRLNQETSRRTGGSKPPAATLTDWPRGEGKCASLRWPANATGKGRRLLTGVKGSTSHMLEAPPAPLCEGYLPRHPSTHPGKHHLCNALTTCAVPWQLAPPPCSLACPHVHRAKGNGVRPCAGAPRHSSGEGERGAWQWKPGWIVTVTDAQHGLWEASEERRHGHATSTSPASLPPASQPSLEACHTAAPPGPDGAACVRVHPRGRDPPRPAAGASDPERGRLPQGEGTARRALSGAAALLEGSGRGRPPPPPPEGARCERQQRPAGTGLPPRGTAPAAEGEDTTQPPSAGIRHVRAAAEPPLPAEPAAPPPSRALRGRGKGGNGGHGAALAPVPGLPLPPRRLPHAGLSAMLAWRPLTPSARRGAGGPGARPLAPPRVAAPHRPAPRCAPGRRGSFGSDSSRRSPSAAAGGSRSRPTPPGGERAAGGTGPIPLPAQHRHGGWRRCRPPGAPPPFSGAAATAPLPLLPPGGVGGWVGEEQGPSSPLPPQPPPSPRPRGGESSFHSLPPPVSGDAPARSGARGGRRRFPPTRPPPPPRTRAPARRGGQGRQGPRHRYSREITARKIW